MQRARERRVNASGITADAFRGAVVPDAPRKTYGKWPTLVDTGECSPDTSHITADELLAELPPAKPARPARPDRLQPGHDPRRAGAADAKRQQEVTLALRSKLTTEIERQLAKWKRELNRHNRPKFIEFCAKYGLGTLQAQIQPNGDPAPATAPGRLSVTEIQQQVVALFGGRLPESVPVATGEVDVARISAGDADSSRDTASAAPAADPGPV